MRDRLAPLLAEVRDGGLATSEGLSYLEAKHLLLLQYCMCIVVYVMLRAEGRQVEGHPVITRCGFFSSRAGLWAGRCVCVWGGAKSAGVGGSSGVPEAGPWGGEAGAAAALQHGAFGVGRFRDFWCVCFATDLRPAMILNSKA